MAREERIIIAFVCLALIYEWNSILSNRHSFSSQWPNDVQFELIAIFPREDQEHVSIKANWLLETQKVHLSTAKENPNVNGYQSDSLFGSIANVGKQWDFYCCRIIIKCNRSCSFFNWFHLIFWSLHILIALCGLTHGRPHNIFLWYLYDLPAFVDFW